MIHKEMPPGTSSSATTAPCPSVSQPNPNTPKVETLADDDPDLDDVPACLPEAAETPLSCIGAVRITPPVWTQSSDVLSDDDGIPISAVDATLPSPWDDFSDAPDVVRAQIDTGAFATVTDQLHMLHDYKAFDDSFPCPVRLLPASENSDLSPLGVGYLHVPAQTDAGY